MNMPGTVLVTGEIPFDTLRFASTIDSKPEPDFL
jgi:hypothetical protein